ncbi:ubiquitinyl hydrolase [Leucogyrophana mollusca]|uniref:Ubiquitinyl hydrolase n=1 Tax=Leucogyrophana mollusca TaxID=85980 RepID=A0ACB8BCT1_9AGAM|nr:ubiquitinyl hydrolase [Leucogyrophana mollusca]
MMDQPPLHHPPMSASIDCPHLHELASLKPPKLSQSVHREECTQCFDNQDSPVGIDVCLTCFNGSCLDSDRHHARTHVLRSGHAFTLNVKRTLKKKPSNRAEDEEPPAKMKKLAIAEEREEDKYAHSTTLKCWKCDQQNGAPVTVDTALRKTLTDGVMLSLSSARQSEVKAWEEEITACEHTLMVEQLTSGPIPAEGLAHCASCDLTSNLWLCLTCGALGCGRAQFGGVGGNGHALAHFEASGHAVCVKLGTITPEGGADIYCYACNDARVDPELTSHLATFGINVAGLSKTEKSMTELQIEQNLTFDFSLTAEDGSALQPVFGPGTTGLSNLGNSCYMASVLQTLFSLPAFQARYYDSQPSNSASTSSPKATAHWLTCTQALPAECLECQMLKLADGLLSGRYSTPHRSEQQVPETNPLAHPAPENTPWQAGLKPAGFKTLVGRGHAEFATMRQQDAEEFFGHLITVLRRFNHQFQGAGTLGGTEPTESFAFGLEQRLECQACKRVRYRVDNMDSLSLGVPAIKLREDKDHDAQGKAKYAPVELLACLNMLLGPAGEESLEYQCEGGCGKTNAVRKTQFATFPEVLVLHAKKFQLVGWVPTKLDIPVLLPPGDELTLDTYLGHGLQPGETELPNVDSGSGQAQAVQFDADAMAQLEGMGFPTVRCQKALLATGNAGAEVAMEWLFGHMEDPDIDDPIPKEVSAGGASGPEPSEGEIAMLADMGFTGAQAKKALRETGGNLERAVEWLFNHPDDTGEDAVPSKEKGKTLPGSTRLPARYKLKAFISHKGPSVHSGHYVAHIRIPRTEGVDAMDVDDSEGRWVLFNDEKVVLADKTSVDELKKLAYLYVFERA